MRQRLAVWAVMGGRRIGVATQVFAGRKFATHSAGVQFAQTPRPRTSASRPGGGLAPATPLNRQGSPL